MAHTSGKWEVTIEDDCVDVRANDRQTVASIHENGEEETMGNARLIAAAPDLLAAIEFVLSQSGLSLDSPCCKKMRQAYAKAKG
jgi:hypothetical protein